ncbi:hypothetical protein [Micromonospora sp. NPDC000668]
MDGFYEPDGTLRAGSADPAVGGPAAGGRDGGDGDTGAAVPAR